VSRRILLLAGALLSVLATGCDSGAGAGGAAPLQKQKGGGAPPMPLLERMAAAPGSVAHSGRRSVWVSYRVGEETLTLAFEERIASGGNGRFRIVPEDVKEPWMPASELEFFKLLQEMRDGFMFHYRDFLVRDLVRYQENYETRVIAGTVQVAEKECVVLEVRRLEGLRTWYRVAVDPETGLVLRCEEFDAGDVLVARTEFLQIDTDHAPAPEDVDGSDLTETPFDPAGDTHALLGFTLNAPTYVPDGYRLRRADRVEAGGETWARLVYGDGVESLFYLQTRPAPRAGLPVPPVAGASATRVIRVFRLGPWTVAQANFEGQRMVVMGKAASDVLEAMLRSADR